MPKSKFKVTCPAMKLRGLKAPKTHLIVRYDPRQTNMPWKEIRPLIACAFRHIQREGFRDLGTEFLRRMSRWTPELILGKSSFWYGRATGYTARVFVGKLHTEAQRTTYPRFKDMPVFWHKDWKEHLVGLTAHELWHRWQPGSGKKAETMCELVESDAIDAYRREQGYTFVPPLYVEREPEDLKHAPAENCVDCGNSTRFWLDPRTPLCPDCCAQRNLKSQPSAPPLPPPMILPSPSSSESSDAALPSLPGPSSGVPTPAADQVPALALA